MTIHLTLKQGSEVKFDACKRFEGHDFLSESPRTNDKGDKRYF